MDKIFAEMFSKQPDEIINGDYFYHNPWYEERSAEISIDLMKMPLEKLREQREHNWLHHEGLRFQWKERIDQNEPLSKLMLYDEYEFSKIDKILNKIATDGKPFMDISSSESFGLIPFIAKLNPQILCMATDIDPHLIKCLRWFIDADLTECNINLASFDNYDIPIKDNSLDYITSTFGIMSSGSNNAPNNPFSLIAGKERPINEVHRILKPGGCVVTIENNEEWKFDLEKARKACTRCGKLFGTYTYDEIEQIAEEWNKVKSASWRGPFTAAGFEVEIEEKYPLQRGFRLVTRTLFHYLTDYYKIHEWTDGERKEYRDRSLLINRKNFNREAADYGIEFNQGEVFYILRKPK